MTAMMAAPTLTPLYEAACLFTPMALSSNPRVVRRTRKWTAAAITSARAKPRCSRLSSKNRGRNVLSTIRSVWE